MSPRTQTVRLAGPRRRPGDWARVRAAPLLVALGLTVLAFIQEFGLLVADTKLDLVLDPGGFLDRIRDLWDPSAGFGQIPNQAVGYWFPMGPFFWVGERVGLPAWVIQRLWIAALLVVAFWGMLRVLEALPVGRPNGRIVGALTYALSPILLAQVAYRSGGLLPTAFLPLALAPLITGSRQGSPRRAAALSAVAVGFMGGVNGAATLLVLAVPALYLLTREPGARRRRLMLWWGGLVVAVSAWWIGPLLLQLRYGVDFLSVTEQAATTTGVNSLTEILRGTAYWELNLRVDGRPWIPAGVRLGSQALTVTGTMLLATLGIVGLALDHLRERRYLVIQLAAGVAAMAAGYAGAFGGPLSGPVQDLLDGPLAPARNLHKLAPLVALPIAVGVAHALDRWATWRAARQPSASGWRAHLLPIGAGLALGAVLATSAAPLLLGEAAPPGAFEEVPDYWRDAIDFIDDNGTGRRTLLLPAAAWGEYEWGRPLDEPLQALAQDPWAVRNIVPLGGLGVTRWLDGVEALLTTGQRSPGLAALLRRAGVEWVLVRNDLDQRRSSPPSPTHVRRVLEQSPGLSRAGAWGPAVSDPLDRRRLAPELAAPTDLQALELYRVEGDVEPVAVQPASELVVAAGGPESALGLLDAGVIDDEPLLLAQDAGADLPAGDDWVLTDDLRRRDVDLGRVHEALSFTLTPTEPAPDFPPDQARTPTDRLPGVDPEDLAVIGYDDVRDVRASSYFTGYGRAPGRQPAAALDGSADTAWAPGAFRPLEDEWWEVRFDRPRSIPWMRVQLPEAVAGGGWIQELEVTTDAGEETVRFASPETIPSIRLPEGPTRRVRLTITEARMSFFDLTTPGLAEVTLPGVDGGRTVVLADTLPEDLDMGSATLALSRERADAFDAASGDEESSIDRTVSLPDAARAPVTGTVSAVAGRPLEALLSGLAQDSRSAARASSTWRGLPAFRAEHAVDGDPATSWLADPTDASPELTIELPRPQEVTRLRVVKAPTPGRPVRSLRVTAGGTTQTVAVDAEGRAAIEAVVAAELTIGFPTDLRNRAAAETLVGLSEIEVLSAGEPTPGVALSPRVRLPCGQGPIVLVNGEATPTRVRGTTADLLASRPLTLEGCAPVTLAEGPNRIQTEDRSGVRVDTLVLGEPRTGEDGSGRSVEIRSWGREHRELTVGPGDEALLTVDENTNAGWEATLAGEALTPFTADGWRQGWVVPEGAGGEIDLRFTPGRLYDRALQLGLALAALVVIALAVPDRSCTPPSAARRIAPLVVIGAGTTALVLATGPVGLVLPVFARWLRDQTLVRIAAAGLLLAGVVIVGFNWSLVAETVFELRPREVTQVLCTVALAAVFARARGVHPGGSASSSWPAARRDED